jgi:hypothetical protein
LDDVVVGVGIVAGCSVFFASQTLHFEGNFEGSGRRVLTRETFGLTEMELAYMCYRTIRPTIAVVGFLVAGQTGLAYMSMLLDFNDS